MVRNFTAYYSKNQTGYMGQLVEWPQVVTEGDNIEDCRLQLRDALNEMVAAYRQHGKEIPAESGLLEQISVNVDDVCQTA